MRKVAVLCISSLLWLCPSSTVYAAAAMVRVQQICAPHRDSAAASLGTVLGWRHPVLGHCQT